MIKNSILFGIFYINFFFYREADLETSQQRCRAEEGPGDEGEGEGTKGQHRWDYPRENFP
jgi:hypothetical protein